MTEFSQKNQDNHQEETIEIRLDSQHDMLAGYEELKRQNRRRLLGASAITLLVGGLFAAVVSGDEQPASQPESEPVAVEQSTAPKVEMLTPDGKLATQVQAASAALLVAEAVAASATVEPVSSAPVDKVATSKPVVTAKANAQDEVVSADTLTNMMSPAPLSANSAEMSAAEKQRITQEAKQNQERIAAEKRRQAREVNARVAAEKAAQQNAVAERAREAKARADQQRAQERAQRIARQQQAAQKQPAPVQNHSQAARDATKNSGQSATVAQTATGRGAAVQVGAYGTRAAAQQVQNKVRGLGYSVHIQEVKTANGTMYRVRTTGFVNRQAALQALSRLKAQGLAGMIVE